MKKTYIDREKQKERQAKNETERQTNSHMKSKYESIITDRELNNRQTDRQKEQIRINQNRQTT